MQKNKNYKGDDFYFIDEKLYTALEWIKKRGIDNVIEDLKKLTLEELKDEYYMNIS